MRHRQVMPGADFRRAFEATGDVLVGAAGRAWLRKRILLGLAGVALIGAATWMVVALRPPDAAASAAIHPVAVQCLACGDRHVVRLNENSTKFPIKCSKCGERACQRLWECRDCGAQFLPMGQIDDIVCPRCQSQRVGAAEVIRAEIPTTNPH